jgi:hypothetical protein
MPTEIKADCAEREVTIPPAGRLLSGALGRPQRGSGTSDACDQGHIAMGRACQNDLTRRYDQLIADATGDIPLREFWKLGKRLFQARFGKSPCSDRGGPQRHHKLAGDLES